MPVFLVVFDAIVECHFDRVATALNEADPDQLVTVLEAVFAAIIETPMA